MRLKQIVLIAIVFLTYNNMSAQIKYDIELRTGSTDFKRTKYEAFEISSYYELGVNYGIGLGVYIPIRKEKVGLITGMSFNSTRIEKRNHDPLNFLGIPDNWIESYYSIDIPIQASYSFEKWVLFNLGVSNRFNIKHSKGFKYGILKEKSTYTIAFIGGADFILQKRIILGVNYYRDLSIFIKLKDLNIYYGYQQISLKLGYMLN